MYWLALVLGGAGTWTIDQVSAAVMSMYDVMTMTNNALEQLFLDHGKAVRDGDRLVLDAQTSIFVRIGSQSMPIDRVEAVELGADLCTIYCTRHETYAVATADVAVVRFKSQDERTGLIGAR